MLAETGQAWGFLHNTSQASFLLNSLLAGMGGQAVDLRSSYSANTLTAALKLWSSSRVTPCGHLPLSPSCGSSWVFRNGVAGWCGEQRWLVGVGGGERWRMASLGQGGLEHGEGVHKGGLLDGHGWDLKALLRLHRLVFLLLAPDLLLVRTLLSSTWGRGCWRDNYQWVRGGFIHYNMITALWK